MTSKNDITGDSIQTKVSSDAYRNNFDAIFRKKVPMSLFQRIKEEQVSARKVGDAQSAEILTLLISESAKVGKDRRNGDPTDEEVSGRAKALIESAKFVIEKGGDKTKPEFEIECLSRFVPKQLTADEIRRWLGETYRGERNKGSMMKYLKEHQAGRYDGKIAAAVVDEILS